MGSIGLPELLIILVVGGVLAGVGVVIVLVVKKASGSGKKRCPYCAELIQEAAQVCRFCGRPVPF